MCYFKFFLSGDVIEGIEEVSRQEGRFSFEEGRGNSQTS